MKMNSQTQHVIESEVLTLEEHIAESEEIRRLSREDGRRNTEAYERSEEGKRARKAREEYARMFPRDLTPYTVTLTDGQQFLCPNERAALQCTSARGGTVDTARLYLRPHEVKELAEQYRWRPNLKSPWREWTDAPEITKKIDDRWESIFHTREEVEDAPAISFATEGFLQEDGITFLGGPSGHGKTLIMLEMCKRLIEGGNLFGHKGFAINKKSDRVIYLVPESSHPSFTAWKNSVWTNTWAASSFSEH
jgi:hypothetical protein